MTLATAFFREYLGTRRLICLSTDPIQRGTALSTGSFGWSGAFGPHFWVDPKEKVVSILMTQTATPGLNVDFENAVMQAIVG